MRYFTICDPRDPANGDFEPEYGTYSEQEILDMYYDYWYGQMCKKFGKEHVDTNYNEQDCIDDWIVVNWAVESEPLYKV